MFNIFYLSGHNNQYILLYSTKWFVSLWNTLKISDISPDISVR